MRHKLLIFALMVLLASFIAGCRPNEPIVGKATVVGFEYAPYQRFSVRFDAIVLGYTAEGEEVTRRWRISSEQFRQLEVGDIVRRIHGDVIRFD